MNNWFFKRSGGRAAWTLQLENRTFIYLFVPSCCLKWETSRSFSPWKCKSFLFHAMFVPKLFLTCKLNYRLVCDMPRVCYCSAFEDHGKKLCSFILSLKTVFNTIFSHFFFQKPFCKSWIMFLVHSRELAIHTFFPFWIMEPKSLLKALFSRCSQ